MVRFNAQQLEGLPKSQSLEKTRDRRTNRCWETHICEHPKIGPQSAKRKQ